MENEITLIDLFSGIGGFAKGLCQAGFKIKKHYFSEINKHSIANYKYNFKHAEYIGSVTDVSGTGFGTGTKILTFGSPCQDLSIAGKRKGLDGERSSLILEAIRVIRESKPDVFIWENVKGAFSSNGGADFWEIIRRFTDIGGYRLEWQLLNTKWVLPQNRERIYLVGHLAGRSEPKVFPFTEKDFIPLKSKLNAEKQIASCLQGSGGHIANGEYKGMNLVMTESGEIRRLTEIESERLQGFPDGWTESGEYDGEIKKVPSTQRYKMCGNAVTVDVVEMVGKRLLL